MKTGDAIEEIGSILKLRGQTLALAESCTGGKLSACFVNSPGVSAFYLGSVVSYANSLKENILGVPERLLKSVGAVSSPVALEMARGLKTLTGATWTTSITGIAGPSGGTKDKPVGTVWFALVGPGIEITEKKFFQGDRMQIQDAAVQFAIELLTHHLKGDQ